MCRYASGSQCGESSRQVSHRSRAQGFFSCKPRVQESGVKAVTRADGIDRFDEERSNPIPLFASLHQSTAGAALDDDQGYTWRQLVERLFGGAGAGDLKELILIG